MNSIKIHAGQWYRQAGAALPAGLVRNNVEKRLAEVAKLRSQLPAPPPAIAPFDEKQAKQHQRRWAEYVGEPVEMTNSIGMKLVVIPPGEFEMGSTPEGIAAEIERAKKNEESQVYCDAVPREGPRHRVKITKPFYLAMYQVAPEEQEQPTTPLTPSPSPFIGPDGNWKLPPGGPTPGHGLPASVIDSLCPASILRGIPVGRGLSVRGCPYSERRILWGEQELL